MQASLVGAISKSETTSSVSTLGILRNGIVNGNGIVVIVTVDNSVTLTKVSDGTIINALPDGSFNSSLITQRFYALSFPNHTGGNFTFTATFSGPTPAGAGTGIYVLEIQNLLTVSPFEGFASAQGTSASPSSGNLSPAPSVDGEYIIGYCIGLNTLTVGGGFADLSNTAVLAPGTDLSGLAQAAHAAVAATWTMTSNQWAAIAVSYKPAPDAANNKILQENNSAILLESGIYLFQ